VVRSLIREFVSSKNIQYNYRQHEWAMVALSPRQTDEQSGELDRELLC